MEGNDLEPIQKTLVLESPLGCVRLHFWEGVWTNLPSRSKTYIHGVLLCWRPFSFTSSL